MLPSWFELREGKGCPLCAPRPAISEYSYLVYRLQVSSLYLTRNQTYRGTCTLVYDRAHVTRPSELSAQSWLQLCADIRLAEAAISACFKPDHVNIECLGNAVPHLHAWIIPRHASDVRWGGPIWTSTPQEMPRLDLRDAACEALAQELRAHLVGAG